MSSDIRLSLLSAIGFTVVVAAVCPTRLQSQSPASSNSGADSKAQAQLSQFLAGFLSDTSSHMRMGPVRTATVADSARAAAFVVAARAALRQYVDVNLAERDGYSRNLPGLEDQPIYHYNSVRNFRAAERNEFDPAKPLSLLYKKDEMGQLRLIGAMYGTGASASPENLDAMLPISVAHWHEHVNLCYPGGEAARYFSQRQKIDAGAAFVLELFLSKTSASECEHAGGQFVPVEFGWMTHVYVFAGSDDPRVVWNSDELGNIDGHMQHSAPNTPY